MNIAVIGSGYVGLVAAACFAELGHHVICVDSDANKIQFLEQGGCPIHEDYLQELLDRHRGDRLTFTTELPESVRNSEVIFIAVGTPASDSGEADLSYVESVAREIAGALGQYKVIVEKSTVPVYTNEWVRRVMLLNGGVDADFDVVSNPEFLREGTAVTDFLYADRIVVGANSARAAEKLKQVYEPLTSGKYFENTTAVPCPRDASYPPPLIITSAKSAELIKHASNAFLAMKISFINAVSVLCEAVEANIEEVCAGVGSDRRIGAKFLRPGIGYGGSCFPKDVAAFKSVARQCGYDFQLLTAVDSINEEQRHRFVRKVRAALWTIKGKRLAVFGLAFKGGTDDIRESPAVWVIEQLLKEGASVVAYDPAGMDRARELPTLKQVQFAANAYEAAEQADAALILTDWEDFAALDLARLKAALRYPIIVDGRNLYPTDEMARAGFMYYSVGRPAVADAETRTSATASRI